MIRDIVKDELRLSVISNRTKDKKVISDTIKDLIDTATEHKENCVGLAAIQIDLPYRIIVVFDGDRFVPYINPIIIDKSIKNAYEAEESCLSLEGTRKTKRYNSILVMYENSKGKIIKQKFTGFQAQIIQHEIDHLNGKLI